MKYSTTKNLKSNVAVWNRIQTRQTILPLAKLVSLRKNLTG